MTTPLRTIVIAETLDAARLRAAELEVDGVHVVEVASRFTLDRIRGLDADTVCIVGDLPASPSWPDISRMIDHCLAVSRSRR